MSGGLAMVKVACKELHLTLPTAPSPVTTHCRAVSFLRQMGARRMRTLRDWVAGAAIVELLGASCVQGRWRVPGPRSAKGNGWGGGVGESAGEQRSFWCAARRRDQHAGRREARGRVRDGPAGGFSDFRAGEYWRGSYLQRRGAFCRLAAAG